MRGDVHSLSELVAEHHVLVISLVERVLDYCQLFVDEEVLGGPEGNHVDGSLQFGAAYRYDELVGSVSTDGVGEYLVAFG